MNVMEFIEKMDVKLNDKQTWFYQKEMGLWNRRGEPYTNQYTTDEVLSSLYDEVAPFWALD